MCVTCTVLQHCICWGEMDWCNWYHEQPWKKWGAELILTLPPKLYSQHYPLTVKTLAGEELAFRDWGACTDMRELLARQHPKLGDWNTFVLLDSETNLQINPNSDYQWDVVAGKHKSHTLMLMYGSSGAGNVDAGGVAPSASQRQGPSTVAAKYQHGAAILKQHSLSTSMSSFV